MIGSENSTTKTPSNGWSQWAGFAVVLVVFIVMTLLSWRKWADAIIDFGSQLYIPWQLNHGVVLYRDLIYVPGGPFSQCFNALLFGIFGASYTTLILANLTLTLGILIFIYHQFLKAADFWTSMTICLAIVLVFAFGHFDMGNYNYVSPYSHEIFHGLILSIITLSLLSSFLKKNRIFSAFGSGLCYGFVFLTKPDIFIALSASVIAAIVLARKYDRNGAKFLGIFAGAALVGPLLFLLYFLRQENWPESFQSTIFAWMPLLKGVAGGYFYKWCMGLDKPRAHAIQMLIWFSGLVLYLAACATLSRQNFRSIRGLFMASISGVIILWLVLKAHWLDVGYLLPPVCLMLCFMLCFRGPQLVGRNWIFPMLWSLFALLMLAKMGLFCRIWNYGFALGMPATAGMIYFLHWLLPLWLEKGGANRRIFRSVVWLTIMCAISQLAFQTLRNYSKINYAIGSGNDEMKIADSPEDHQGENIAMALNWLRTNTPPTATLAVLPEGPMVNYLCHKINPTGCLAWSPAELQMFGQTNLISRFEANRPDYVMLLQRSSAEYGLNYFGQQPEFGKELIQWVRENYKIVFQQGAVPLQTNEFGLQILEYKTNSIP